MKNKYSIQQLEELVQQFKKQVMPSIFDKRSEIFNQLQTLQQENCLYSRSLYLLIYYLFIDETKKTITHEDFTIDILNTDFEKISNESCLGSFETQVFLNAIKELNNNTLLFASALISTKDENKSFPYKLFAFSTFPSIFSYFTSSELFDRASLLIHDLLSLEGPAELLNPMILSFFLSLYSFIDALWNDFYLLLSNRPNIKDDDIMESLMKSISDCAILIPTPAYEVMKELLLNRSELLNEVIIKSFLPITFHLWYMHSGSAMSFEFGSEVLRFFEENADTQKGVMLSSLFVIDSNRIEVIPSFTSQCKFSSEVLFFSNIDMKLFVEAFSPISSNIQLFETLQEASNKCDEYPPFMPFPISFFMSSSKKKVPIPSIFNYPKVKVLRKGENIEGEIFYVDDINDNELDKESIIIEEPENDSVFEIARQEMQQNKKIQNSTIFKSEEFQIYSLTKDLLNLIEIAETQEFCISLKIQLDITLSYQKSILNLRRYSYSDYISRYLKESNIDQNKETIESKTLSILENCTEKSLIIPTFIEVSNSVQFSFESYESMHQTFLSIIRSFIEASWKQTGRMSTNKYVMNLVPLLSRRKRLQIGDYFYLLDQILVDLRKICSHYYKRSKIEDAILILLQAIIYSSNTDVVLDIFLFYEKIAFRYPNFLSNLKLDQSKNWNIFFQIMWKALERSKKLFQDVMDLKLVPNSNAKKKKISLT